MGAISMEKDECGSVTGKKYVRFASGGSNDLVVMDHPSHVLGLMS